MESIPGLHKRLQIQAQYDNPIPTRFRAPKDCSKIPALVSPQFSSPTRIFCFIYDQYVLYRESEGHVCTEAEFLDVIGTKVFGVFLLSIQSHLSYGFYLSKNGLKLVCNVNIVYGNLSSEKLARLCPENSTKLYVHEFGFCSPQSWNFITIFGG